MKKRGQATIFIIIGAVIVAIIVILSLILTQQPTDEKQPILTLQQYKLDITSQIENCLREEGANALANLGSQGGRLILPEDHLVTSYSKTAYAYYEGNSTFPTIEEMEEELAIQIEVAMPICVTFDSRYINQTGKLQATAQILEDSVKLDIIYPLEITLEDTVTNLQESQSETFDIRLGYIHNTVNDIVQDTIELPGIDILFLDELDMKITVDGIDESTVVYILEDQKSNINEEPYIFIFANKFVPFI